MNVLIDGAGAIGIALGASLISQGFDVSFFAKGETANAIESNGIKRTGLFKEIVCNKDEYKVYRDYKSIADNSFDFVLVCSKTLANDEISRNLYENRNILKENASIIIFQNGFGNDEPYLRYFSPERVYCARVITGFTRPERNISQITVHTAPVLIGSLCNNNNKPVECIANAINNSGIESQTTNELAEYLWAKMLYNCALNPLSAILDLPYGKLAENDYSKSLMNGIIDEIFAVIEKSGYKTLWQTPDEYKELFYSKLIPDTYSHCSSTLQDIRKKNKTEIDTLTGKIISLGEKNGVETPINKVIYNIIKTIELNF